MLLHNRSPGGANHNAILDQLSPVTGRHSKKTVNVVKGLPSLLNRAREHCSGDVK